MMTARATAKAMNDRSIKDGVEGNGNKDNGNQGDYGGSNDSKLCQGRQRGGTTLSTKTTAKARAVKTRQQGNEGQGQQQH